jgi:dehydrogenase/reductase SDR family protein 12
MASLSQFNVSPQVYLYGKRYCTRSGWEVASANYDEAEDIVHSTIQYDNMTIIITGATSTIGMEIFKYFAVRKAIIYLFCRINPNSEQKINEIIEISSNSNIFIINCDLSLEIDVRKAWSKFVTHQQENFNEVKLNCLVLNAGCLKQDLQYTNEGVEVSFALNLLFGTYLLTTLAISTLEKSQHSRVISVSSSAMYNTKFPVWKIATAEEGEYNGYMAYYYAKRGQVILCEQWAIMHPSVMFLSCHPGWVDSQFVDSTYGTSKKFLEPLRIASEGAEGIIWLCIAPVEKLQNGGFYLDRSHRVKHIIPRMKHGIGFSTDSLTRNTQLEIEEMMHSLDIWSNAESRIESGHEMSLHCLNNLKNIDTSSHAMAMQVSLDRERFMGRWHVIADIPSSKTKNTVNNIEEYIWDGNRQIVCVRFKYSSVDSDGVVSKPTVVKQHGALVNSFGTEWAIEVKVIIYWSVSMHSLILDVDEGYEMCMIGVSDRSTLRIMSRQPQISDDMFRKWMDKAAIYGYDINRIVRIPYIDNYRELDGIIIQNSKQEQRSGDDVLVQANSVKSTNLLPMQVSLDRERFMGRWHVIADIPSSRTKNTVNNIEEYTWDENRQIVCVRFKYSSVDSDGVVSKPTVVKQHGTLVNSFGTEWAIEVKVIIYWSVSMHSLILDVDEGYEMCMIGVSDRSTLRIMSRQPQISDELLYEWKRKAELLGYNANEIVIVPYLNSNKNPANGI